MSSGYLSDNHVPGDPDIGVLADRLGQMSLYEIIDQCLDDSQAWFPDKAQDVPFLVLACMGELGEVANLVKKIERGTHTYGGPEGLREQLWEETIDVFIYLMNIFAIWHRDGMDVVEAYQMKRAANLARFARKVEDE